MELSCRNLNCLQNRSARTELRGDIWKARTARPTPLHWAQIWVSSLSAWPHSCTYMRWFVNVYIYMCMYLRVYTHGSITMLLYPGTTQEPLRDHPRDHHCLPSVPALTLYRNCVTQILWPKFCDPIFWVLDPKSCFGMQKHMFKYLPKNAPKNIPKIISLAMSQIFF